ncbi:response regulator receiver modulated diguanylate cyclase [Solidesulfovibrio fructosivorans JJ]]|uniref:diguanylate cyclase n=1 Tax=Solidesulfovibrio fructosivorans JJ] TaxID=596151 RepID=E1JX18_SOLFR|nr:diguanylate cyclase [Solidesulfovibrio fructosivorans]EFL51092.1 response regulator receiver modulated diguanylate cyclase [Solidesulfovibrio fructosivorans JJ]]
MDTPVPPATVLVVDDAPSNLAILTETLRSEFDVRIATSGFEALHLVCDAPPDLILLDILMPEMDGYEVCRRLKADFSTRNIPVIFLTAKNEVSDETTGLALGAVDYITKPITVPIVQARVRAHVELKRRGDLLETLSMRDGLTGIPNRRRFDEYLNRAWRHALRCNTPLSMIMADIDDFKAYNDAYGHMAGDECLRAVAGALSGALRRPGDLVARFGGEEFAVVLEHTELPGALHLAEAMRAAVIDLDLGHEDSRAAQVVTVSLGAATLTPKAGMTPETLIGAADRMLYAAKQAGRNRVLGDTTV